MQGSKVLDNKSENEPTSNPIIYLSKDLNWKKREVLLECIHPPCRRSSDVEFFQIKKSHRGAGMSKILVETNLCSGRHFFPPPDSGFMYLPKIDGDQSPRPLKFRPPCLINWRSSASSTLRGSSNIILILKEE